MWPFLNVLIDRTILIQFNTYAKSGHKSLSSSVYFLMLAALLCQGSTLFDKAHEYLATLIKKLF